MKDIQSQLDHRRINIKKVGVKNISYPIRVLDKSKRVQRTVAKVNMYVNLPHRFKGTHMSRFVEILNRFHGEIGFENFHRILEEMKGKLDAQAAHIEIEFPYFLKKNINHVNAIIMSEYECKMHGSLDKEFDLTLEIKVPISPPLPDQCIEELPRSLGHWGYVQLNLRFRRFIWIEDLIQLMEEVIRYSRQPESFVRFQDRPSTIVNGPQRREETRDIPLDPVRASASSELPLSVEKLSKAFGERLAGHSDISWFSVTVENLAEGYSVFSSLEWPTPLQH